MRLDLGSLAARATMLRRLHDRFLVLPNAWDAASAGALAALGFPALATTSSGVAASLGYDDREQAPVDAMFGALAAITSAVDVPVTADLEAGYRLPADDLVERMLAAGACGLNLEDSDHHSGGVLVDAEAHATRLAALKAAARERGVDVVLNARIDVHLRRVGERDTRLAEALRRARLYLEAGADCIYPIMVIDEPTLRAFVEQQVAPINVLYADDGPSLSRLAQLGVRRVTFGGLLQSMGIDRAADYLKRVGAVGSTA